jgi:predicted RND superfamily exporter protein
MTRPLGPSEIAKPVPAHRPKWAWGVLALTLALLPLIGMGLKNVKLSNDTESWLPLDDPHGQILRWHQDAFKTGDTIMVSWEGSTLNDPRVEALAARLNGESGEQPFGVSNATAPHKALANMVDLDVPQEEALRRLRGTFLGSGFLKIRLTDHGRQHREQAATKLIEAGEELGLNAEIYPAVIEPEEWLAADAATAPGDEEESELSRPFPAIPAHDLQLRWREISPETPAAEQMTKSLADLEIDGEPIVEESFFAYGSPVAVSIEFTEEGLLHLNETMAALHAAAEQTGIAEEDLHLGGSAVVSHRLSTESGRALWNPDHPLWKFYKRSPVILSALVGMLISFVVLRSMWLAAIVMFVSVYSATAMMALVASLGTHFNLVLVVMPNLLMVLTLSGSIHLANYWSHAVVNGDPRPVESAVKTAGLPAFIASLTTAIGLMSLLTSQLTPVRDFGWYSAWGCMLSLFLILGVLPAILALFPPRGAKAIAESSEGWETLGDVISPRYKWIAGAAAVLTAAGCWGLLYFKTETKGIRYFPEETRVVKDYRYLEESLSGIINLDVDIHFPGERETEDSEEGETDEPPDFDRRNVFDRMRIVQQVEEAVRSHPMITGTLSVVDFQVLPEPPGSEATSRDRILYGRRAQRTENELFVEPREGASQFVQLADAPLDVSLEDRDLDWRAGEEVWRIRAQCSVMSDTNMGVLVNEVNQEVSAALAGEEDVQFAVTGLVPLMLRTQQEVLDSLVNSFGLSFLFIVFVRALVLRNITAGFITMFPNFLPVLVVFGMISWAGIAVDMGTMITASVALGIADDCTVHLLTWFQEGIRKGLGRREAVSNALRHCGPAMWQTSVSISLGLLMLWGADLLLISRFGWLMAAQILLALVADIILTPALLCGTLGKMLEEQERKRRPVPPPELTISPSESRPVKAEQAPTVEAAPAPAVETSSTATGASSAKPGEQA